MNVLAPRLAPVPTPPVDPVGGPLKHLLRHLYDPMALRRNPLATRLLGRSPLDRHPDDREIEHVRAVVLETIRTLSEAPGGVRGATHRARHHAILTRYEIGGEARHDVAASLGISLRQFYRERRLALARLADRLSSR